MADINELKLELKKLRDELDLKMHLASLEMKQEYQRFRAALKD